MSKLTEIKPKIVAVVGPTAAGKTALAIELAKQIDGEIVSCDSMQVYRGLDIGTAKPDECERQGVPHHMLGVAEPYENYSAARYAREAAFCIADILARHKRPIVAGGTGLYLRALTEGLEPPPPVSAAIRKRLSDMAAEQGPEACYALLKEKDARRAAQLHPNDVKRVLRALEVIEQTGEPFSRAVGKGEPPYDVLKLGVGYADRALLYDRIHKRVDEMLCRGLLKEVEGLLCRGLPAECTALQAIGYKELTGVVRGQEDLETAVETIKKRTRQYAKRQMTWFGADASVQWMWAEEGKNSEQSTRLVRNFGLR